MTAATPVLRSDVEGVSKPQVAMIAIIAGEGVQIPVLLDAKAPVSVMTEPLLKVVNDRLHELDEASLVATGRGRWVLCLVDGTPLRSAQSLTEQDVYDGDRLWLRFVEDTEHRSQVIEHVSTAVSSNLGKRFSRIDATLALQAAATMGAVGVLAATGLLGWWRWGHDSWLTSVYAAVIALLVFAVAVSTLVHSKAPSDRMIGELMLLTGLAPLTVAAAAAPPGPVGAPQAVLGFAVLGVAAMLILRFTGRQLAMCTAIATVSIAVTVTAGVRMIAMSSAVTLLGSLLLACVVAYHATPTLARRLSGIRLPVFPSPTSHWVFEARPDLPIKVVSDDGAPPTLEGPASVRDVLAQADRAHAFLTGLLVGLGLLVLVCTTALSDPRADKSWLPVLLASFTAGFLLFRSRSYVDRWQSIILASTAGLIIAALLVRYVLVLASPATLSVAVAILVLLPAAGLLAAAVVPNTTYSPLFRKLVESIEYFCLVPIFPLAMWLMDVYAAIRHR